MNLLFLKLKVAFINAIEYVKVLFNYYKYPKFAKADIALLSLYLFRNPFAVSKQFHQKRGDDELYVYGETPLTTLDLISSKAEIQPTDTVFELGAGRGRTAFWLWGVIGCKVVAIEEIDFFVNKANQVIKKQKLSNVIFKSEDFLTADLSSGDVFYLYGSALPDEAIEKLAQRFKKGDKVISVSYPLSDYNPSFKITHQFPAPFTWGWADVYIQIRK